MTTRQEEASLLPRKLTPEEREAVLQWLRSRVEVDEEEATEQRETLDYLKRALDEDRPEGYKHFG